MRLFVNGALVATRDATGTLSRPTPAEAEMFVLGGDAAKGKPAFFAPAHIAASRIFSRPLGLEEVLALQAQAFGQRDAGDLVTLRASTPAAGERLTSATELALEFNNAQAIGRDVTYTLDGEPVASVAF